MRTICVYIFGLYEFLSCSQFLSCHFLLVLVFILLKVLSMSSGGLGVSMQNLRLSQSKFISVGGGCNSVHRLCIVHF